jgi:hypothetical protein
MELLPEQINAYKKMSPTQKLLLAAELWHLARELKRSGLKQQHPEWSEEQIEAKVREIFLNART